MAEQLTQSVKFKRNYVAHFAVFLFFAMVVGEITLAIAIPSYMKREDSLALQVRKLNLLSSFDWTRNVCSKIPANSEIALLEKKLFVSSLDDLAYYLRKEADHLTSDELDQIQKATTQIAHLAHRAQRGYIFSQEIKLDTAGCVDALLRKNPPQLRRK